MGHQYTHDVTAKKYGRLQHGSRCCKVNWTKYRTSSDHRGKVKLGSGAMKIPAEVTGWRYRSTNS